MAKIQQIYVLSRFSRWPLTINCLNKISKFSTESNQEIHLGSYLAGIFEGDGHISISKSDSKVNNLSLSITFHLKDFSLPQRLKDVLGYGWIRIKKNENACVLTFHTIDGLIYIVSLMNSYLRTPKLKKFNDLIDILNQKKGLTINKYPVQTQSFSKDGWLAGFIDAVGMFSIINISFSFSSLENGSSNNSAVAITEDSRLHPKYITGFFDGEGTFSVSIRENGKCKTGWNLDIVCAITTHKKDLPLLKKIQFYFGVGGVYKQSENTYGFRVRAIKDLEIIINHFYKYPLLTKKRIDFILFKLIVDLMKNREHLTHEGLRKIVALKASMNRGLTEELVKAFPNILPHEITLPVPFPSLEESIDLNWLAGFTEAEGRLFLCGNYFIKII